MRCAGTVCVLSVSVTSRCSMQKDGRPVGDAENAGLENAGLENVGPNHKSGKGRTGKRGNITCMGSEM